VRVARCDARGKLLGDWFDGTCAIVEDAGQRERMKAALVGKYTWQIRILDFFSSLFGRAKRRAYLEISLAPAA
jgi:hypothetical protein